MIGQRVELTFVQGVGVITDIEYPWGEDDEPLYTVEMDNGKVAYAVASQLS